MKPQIKKYSSLIDAIFEKDADSIKQLLDNPNINTSRFISEVQCAKCQMTFGLIVSDNDDDLKYFQENYNFCNKCGEPVDWY